LSAIEDRYQIDLNETRFAEARTVRELEQVLRHTSTQRSDYKYPRWPQRWPITWIRLAVYYVLVWPATLLLGFPQVIGRANLRGIRGPVLVISNHVTSIDIGFLLAALPARLRHRLAVATGGERLAAMRQPPADLVFLRRCLDRINYALALALFNAFPLPKQSGFRESFVFADESMDRGYSVLVFPEGQCTEDGKLLSFRAGIGLLANNLKVPIVPVRIDGLFELKQGSKKIARPGQVKVTIGAPIEFPAAADPQQIAKVLEARVAALGREATPGPQRRNQL